MELSQALIAAAFVPAALFALIYGLGFPWWRNPLGWSRLNLAVVIALALSLSVWRTVTGASAPEPFRLFVYGWIVLALWAELAALLFAPRMNRRAGRRRAERRDLERG